ncbi:ABC transporter ATP-binding protein [Actinomadura sp. NPDC048394]|uniref:ABC transporter ATP-binding protein n=1 Tax=Actinomadura sp. NPDC048394 TaxID=3158223 RepID=UPI0033D94655
MRAVIEATGLRVQDGPSTALSFTVPAGEVHALLGRAGAGKTALLETAAGLRRPLSGTVRVKGLDPYADRDGLRLGSVWREGGLFPGLTVAEIVDSWRRWTLDPLTRADALRLTGLTARASTPFERLDAGERRLLDLTLALVNRSDVLFLDEPVAGLDTGTIHRIWTTLRSLADAGTAVLLTTRHPAEAALADRTRTVDEAPHPHTGARAA